MEKTQPGVGTSIKFVLGGKEFFTLLLQLIGAARERIHLQTYIFGSDETGTMVAEALMAAARRGVDVYMLVDGYASQELPADFRQKLMEAGIRFRYFEPLFKSSHFYFGRRLHHKIAVVDEERALVCGLNIADRYNDLPEQRAWLDLGLLVSGPPAGELAKICYELWTKKRKKAPLGRKRQLPPAYPLPEGQLRICRNDWVMGKQEIYRSYRDLFIGAKKDITILCSYFLPGVSFKKKLSSAAGRGVRVRVVLAGTSDLVVVKYAERYLYRWMLRHNMEVYEYQPAVLHAKLALADGEVLTLGSYNVNDLSALASIELNLEVRQPAFVRSVQKEVDRIIQQDCIPFHPDRINIYSFEHFLQLCSFYLLRFLLTLSTFYFKKQQ